MSDKKFRAKIFWKNEEKIYATINEVRVLGAGRAATATLVEVTPDGQESFQCVEKCFNPGLLTRFIYWMFMQAPFPYQHDRDAISAAYYRRAALGKILAALDEGKKNPVAEPLYTRWDAERCAYVLAARLVEGRGIIPQKADAFWFRRGVYNRIICPLALLVGKKLEKKPSPPEEVKELVSLMRKYEQCFKQSGFTGTGWQTAPATMVATANLLRTNQGYIIIDLESGIPALLVPYYLFRSVFTFRFPFFDDLEPARIMRYMQVEREQISSVLGELAVEQLENEIQKLIECSARWKQGEIAIFRNLTALLFNPIKRKAVKRARVAAWLREGVIDQETYNQIAQSGRLFTDSIFISGFLPGRFGRFIRKLKGNSAFRAKVRFYLTDRAKRKARLQKYVAEHLSKWIEQQRFPTEWKATSQMLSFGPRFFGHLFFSKITSSGFHRFFIDPVYRKRTFIKIGLFFTSERYQTEYAKYVILKGMKEWKDESRINETEFNQLNQQLDSGSMQEYIRMFGFHAALKIFEVVTSAIKIAGIGWYLTTFAKNFPDFAPGDPVSTKLMAAFIQSAILNPIAILMIVNTSVWRTLITLSRMFSIKRRHISYKIALFFGMIPALGTLAYPVQMYAGSRSLSIYLMRHIFSRIGRHIPVYGSKDSLTELFMIKTVNLLVETFEIVKWFWQHTFGVVIVLVSKPFVQKTQTIRRAAPQDKKLEKGRWTHLVDEYIDELRD